MTTPRPATRPPRPPTLTSLLYSLPVRRLKEILSHVVPNATLGPVEEIPSTQLPRLYNLNMSDGQKLLLSFAPSLAVRLLRQEATLLSSEAILVDFLANSGRRSDVAAASSSSSSFSQAQLPRHSSRLSELIPRLLKHSSNNKEMAYPYSIYEPTPGAALSTLSIYLSLTERRTIDKQVGFMARALASLTSPSGTFGPVSRVLPDPFIADTSIQPVGSKTWAAAFNSLLEGILRDGEDMSVLLPYEVVRAHYHRLSWRLDAVTQPRLVILDAGTDTNVMIERGLEEGSSTEARPIRLTGLRSWSLGCFGDPLVASCWEVPSDGFLEGWREESDDVIEDTDGADIRILLYRCYTAIVSIVTEYYRPQADSSRRELEGRRKLTNVLADLDKVDVVANDDLKRARRSISQEAESSKRPRFFDEV